MYRGHIPGYYWDSQRRKYFKVVPNHVGGRYSTSTVAKIKNDERKSRYQAQQADAIREQLVQRNPILSAPLGGGTFLNREIGRHSSNSNILESRTQAFGSGLTSGWAYHFAQQISAFTYDQATGDFLVGSRCGSGHSNLITFEYSDFSHSKDHHSRILEAFGTADISSIALSPSRVVTITGTGGPKAMVAFISLCDLDMRPPDALIECDVSISFLFPSDTTAWSSAANPFLQDQSMVVIGMSDGAMRFTNGNGSWEDIEREDTQSDVLAVEWLTPTVVCLGQRNGAVKLWDIRSSGSALRLQHPSRITGLRRVNDHSLVTCGLQSALAMYDLRMPIGTDSAPPAPKRRHKVSGGGLSSRNPTLPVLRFDHQNESNWPLGFDVDSNKSLVAAANDRSGIDLFSLTTGDIINTDKHVQERLHRHLFPFADYHKTPEREWNDNLILNLQFCRQSDNQPSESFLFGSTRDSLFSLGWQSHMEFLDDI